MNERTPLETALLWLTSIASLAGLVWLWINLDFDDMMLTKVIIVAVLWALWVGIVFVAVGLLALLLGMIGFVVSPFRRK